MKTIAFASMIATIGNLNRPVSHTISRIEYETFQREFIFQKLKGKSFGLAFCEKFDITDFILEHLSDNTAKYHIENLGYIDDINITENLKNNETKMD